MDKPIYALSVRQPWAWLICKNLKDVENRDWPLEQFAPKEWRDLKTKKIILPQRIYIHASKTLDKASMEWLLSGNSPLDNFTWAFTPEQFGAIVGETDIVDCVIESDSHWFFGNYGLVIENSVSYDKPIPCKGRLGFFKPELN
jgi:hypothetical protein